MRREILSQKKIKICPLKHRRGWTQLNRPKFEYSPNQMNAKAAKIHK